MTGAEAWSIIAPILAAHMIPYKWKLSSLDEAYVITFVALKEYDEREKKAGG